MPISLDDRVEILMLVEHLRYPLAASHGPAGNMRRATLRYATIGSNALCGMSGRFTQCYQSTKSRPMAELTKAALL